MCSLIWPRDNGLRLVGCFTICSEKLGNVHLFGTQGVIMGRLDAMHQIIEICVKAVFLEGYCHNTAGVSFTSEVLHLVFRVS